MLLSSNSGRAGQTCGVSDLTQLILIQLQPWLGKRCSGGVSDVQTGQITP